MRKTMLFAAFTLLGVIGTSCLCQAQTAEVPIKPTLVNLQVDLETAEDAQYVMPLLELIESYGWYTTVYVTGEFTLQFPDLVKAIHDRGHQIGVAGWAADESFTALSDTELFDLLENAFLVVRSAVDDMRLAYIADFKPQDGQLSPQLLRILEQMEVRSCTAYFPEGPLHPHHVDVQHVGPVAVPLSALQVGDRACDCQSEGVPLVDEAYQQVGRSVSVFLEDVEAIYGEYGRVGRPAAVAVHPAIVFSTSADRAEMQALLSTIAQSDGRVVVVDQLTAQANPFIDWIELEVPADARAGDTVTATLRYQSNCYCPRYYFRIYACDDQFGCGIPIWRRLVWKNLAQGDDYHNIGVHTLQFDLEVPLKGQNYTWRLVAVGQACHGGPCWPTYWPDSLIPQYDAIDEAEIQIRDYNVRLLFVPLNWENNTQAEFDEYVTEEVERFIDVTPLSACLDAPVLAEILDVTSQNLPNYEGDLTNLRNRVRDDIGIDVGLYNVVVGVAPDTPVDPQNPNWAGLSNGSNTIWTTMEYTYVLAHELGHIRTYGGLLDEYCSKDAGSSWLSGCSSGNAQPNPLDEDPPCDCPSDGSNDSTDVPCCEGPGMNRCEDGDGYVLCCHGNRTEGGGRCIMSSATTQLDRQFCVHCSNRMMNMTSLDTCVGDLLPSAVGQPGTETELVVALELRITPADEVTEGLLAVRSGTEAPLPAYRGDEPTYVLSLLGYDGDVLVEESFTVSFFYSGPVVEGVDYSGDGVDEFDLSVRLPFLNGMSHVQIRHGDQVIHTEDLPVATVHGTVTTAGIPIADAQVTLHGPGNERAMARTSTAGEFVLAVTVPGQYTLSVDPLDPNMFPGERLVVLTLGDSYREDFDLQTAGSIDGSVLDALGAPVTEAWIYPDVFEPPYYKVQENGEYLMSALDPGTYTIAIDAPGYGDWHIYVNGQYVATSTSVVVDVALGETTRVDFSQRLGVLLNFEYPSQEAAEVSGWIFNGLWHLATEAQCSAFSPNPTPFPSSTHAAHFCDPASGAYATTPPASPGSASPQQRAKQAEASEMAEPAKSYGELITPEISVSGETQVDLRFEHFREVEYYADGSYDKTHVQVQFDGGAWQTVWFLDSKTPSERVWTEAGPITIPVPTGASVMRIKFVFDSVDNYGNDGLGWLIDDISISGPEPVMLRITTQGLPTGTANLAYTASLSAAGGTPPYTWSATGLPPGFSLDSSTGAVSGTPTNVGTYDVAVTVTDSGGGTASRQYQVAINPAELPPVGVLFEEDFADAGGWTMSGLWHATDALGCVDLTGYGAAAYYGLEDACSYGTGARTTGVLASPVIDVTGAVAVQVRFDHLREVEPFGDDAYDLTLVEAKLGDGPWRVIWARDSTSPSAAAWEQATTSSFATDGAISLQIRFVFDTVDQWANDFIGWLVDNVFVDSMPSGTPLSLMSVLEAAPRGTGGRVEIFNAPNPVREEGTKFVARGVSASALRVEVYDLSGTIVWEGQTAGNELPWDGVKYSGERLANGVYLYRASVQIGDAWLVSEIRKLVILR